MSIASVAVPRRAPAASVVRAAGRIMQRWWLAYMTWRIERLAISRLSAMSDRQLNDIGIQRSQIESAVLTPRASSPGSWAPCCATPSRGRS
jgi:uncharacterized protein YjiS (DUF1127 family)